MPWTPADAANKTKKVKTAKEKRQWAHVANEELKRTGDDALAIKAANGVVKKTVAKRK